MRVISRNEAKAEGLIHYFTGLPCKRNHLCNRLVSTAQCTSCLKIRVVSFNPAVKKAWQEKNREKRLAQARARYAKNPDKYVKKSQTYYSKNSDLVREKRRKYHYKIYRNAEVRELARARTREWSAANPERSRANARNGKAKRKNVTGKHTAADIRYIGKLQGGKCAYCKVRLGKKFHIDHILPVSRGGTNDPQNLQITCPACNLSKGATDPIEFSRRLGMLL